MLDKAISFTYNEKVSKKLPIFDIYGLMVKRLRHRPFTAESGVRFPLRLPQQVQIELFRFGLLSLFGFSPAIAKAKTKTTKAIKKGLNDSKFCKHCGKKN